MRMAEESKASFIVGNGDELDDWEAMDESGVLDRQMDELKSRIQKEDELKLHLDPQMPSDRPCLEYGKVTILKNTSEQRTQHPGKTIKILKRPPEELKAMAESMGERKPSVKSLEEREKEYQEARKRILGKEVENNHTDNSSSGSESSPRLAHRSNTGNSSPSNKLSNTAPSETSKERQNAT